jgi:hypothetical protein
MIARKRISKKQTQQQTVRNTINDRVQQVDKKDVDFVVKSTSLSYGIH